MLDGRRLLTRGRILLLLVLLLLGGVGAEAVQVAANRQDFKSPASRPPKPPFADCLARMTSQPDSFARLVDLDLQGRSLAIKLRLTLPRSNRCAEVLRYELENRAVKAATLKQLFGTLKADGQPISLESLTLDRVHRPDTAANACLQWRGMVEFRRLYGLRLDRARTDFSTRHDSVHIHLADATIGYVWPEEAAVSDTEVALGARQLEDRDQMPRLAVTVEGVAHDATEARHDNRSLLLSMPRALNGTPLLAFVILIGRVAPLVLLLILWRSTSSDWMAYRGLTMSLAAIVLLCGLARLFAGIYFGEGVARDLSEALDRWLISLGFRSWRYPLLGYGAKFVLIMLVTVLLPTPAAEPAGKRGRPISGLVIRSLIGAALVAALLWAQTQGQGTPRNGELRGVTSHWTFAGTQLVFAVRVTVAGLVLWWISAEAIFKVLHGTMMGGIRVMSALALLLLLAAIERFVPWGRGSALCWFAVTTWVGVALLREIARSGDLPASVTAVPETRRSRLLWGGLLVALSLPLGPLLRDFAGAPEALHLGTATATIDLAATLGYAAWLIAALTVLRKNGENTVVPKADAICVGAVAGGSVLLALKPEWAGLPVTYCIGVVILILVLHKGQSGELAAPEGGIDALRRALAEELAVRRRRNALMRYRNASAVQLQKSEITLEQFDKQMAEAVAGLSTAPEPTRSGLSWGPKESAWANGVHGARYALLLGAPWIVAGIVRVLRQDSDWLFPQTMLCFNALLASAQLVGMGFCLGYFFPLWPGKNGALKGLVLGMSVALATVPLAILTNTTLTTLQGPLVWAIQIVFHGVIVGLVGFDFYTFRKHTDAEWKALPEMLGAPALGAAASTVGVAVGTAVVALVSDRAASLVVQALQYAMPVLASTTQVQGPHQ